MASLTRWTWVWLNSWSWWRTGRPGVLRIMGLQRVGYSWTHTWHLNESYDKPRKHVKQRHHCADKVLYGFSSSHVWMWELNHKEGWTLKNWFFWTVVLEKTLESPWAARKSNQWILKEINPEYSFKGLMLKLKLQYFGHLMQRGDSLEKTLMLGKVEGRRRRGWQRMRWLDGIIDSMDMNLNCSVREDSWESLGLQGDQTSQS